LRQNIKEVAIQGRIRSKGLVQALSFKTMKDAGGQRQMHHPYYNMSLRNFLVPWDDDDATYSSCDELYQIAACKPLVGGNMC
jgi:hypothetical protein